MSSMSEVVAQEDCEILPLTASRETEGPWETGIGISL